MGAQISQVQPSQGNQPVNPRPTSANYSPVQQQYGGGKGLSSIFPQQQLPVGAPIGMADRSAGMPEQMDFSGVQGDDFGYSGRNQAQNPMFLPRPNGGRKVMYSPTSNQPSMGQPNPYPNTVGQWDNASIQPQPRQSGKGKGI